MSSRDDDHRLLDAIIKSLAEKYKELQSTSPINLRHHPPGTEKESWQRCHELIERYDKDLCTTYREEIDTLLVFAGLFSAVVTAFTVESYQWLHEDSGDVTIQLLAQIAAAMSPASRVQTPATSALSDAAARRINSYWFVSLILSLSAALVGILAKQWIREYDRDTGRTHQESLGVRQMKLEGLQSWKVPEIVTSVPLALQAALTLFFLGIIELLWQLNTTVAVPVTIVVALAFCFYAATTFLPAGAFCLAHWDLALRTAAQCPYKSPQAWLAVRAAIWLNDAYLPDIHAASIQHDVQSRFTLGIDAGKYDEALRRIRQAGSWVTLDLAYTALKDCGANPEFSFQALAWIRRTLDHSDMPNMIWHCLQHTLTRKSYGSHSPSNILCCMPRPRSVPESLLFWLPPNHALPPGPVPPTFLKHTWMQCQFYLLTHAFDAQLPANTQLELLCQILFRAERSLRLSGRDYSVFSHCFSRISPEGEIPETLLDDMFLAVCCMTELRVDADVATIMLKWFTFILSEMQPSQHHTRLTLACCARARRRLRESCMHANDCLTMLRFSIFSTQKEIEDGPPYSPETVFFASFALDIDIVVRERRIHKTMTQWAADDVFHRLLDVAFEYSRGDESDSLSDAESDSLSDVDSDSLHDAQDEPSNPLRLAHISPGTMTETRDLLSLPADCARRDVPFYVATRWVRSASDPVEQDTMIRRLAAYFATRETERAASGLGLPAHRAGYPFTGTAAHSGFSGLRELRRPPSPPLHAPINDRVERSDPTAGPAVERSGQLGNAPEQRASGGPTEAAGNPVLGCSPAAIETEARTSLVQDRSVAPVHAPGTASAEHSDPADAPAVERRQGGTGPDPSQKAGELGDADAERHTVVTGIEIPLIPDHSETRSHEASAEHRSPEDTPTASGTGPDASQKAGEPGNADSERHTVGTGIEVPLIPDRSETGAHGTPAEHRDPADVPTIERIQRGTGPEPSQKAGKQSGGRSASDADSESRTFLMGIGIPLVQGRERRRSVDLELGGLHECADECGCTICVRQKT